MLNTAIIDIGSNSIRYCEYTDGVYSKKEVYTTRLASGIVNDGKLSDESMKKSVSVITELVRKARKRGLMPVAYATSAVRDAENRGEFLKWVYESAGITVDVLSGEREAMYAYEGATGGKGGGLIDIGGGSTQIITGDFRISLPIGCVRGRDICKGFSLSSYKQERKAFEKELEKLIILPELHEAYYTGVGGTITTLAMLAENMTEYEPDRITGYRLTLDKIEELIKSLDDMGDEKRKALPPLIERHDVILYGAAILAFEMRLLKINELFVSDRDGMESTSLIENYLKLKYQQS